MWISRARPDRVLLQPRAVAQIQRLFQEVARGVVVALLIGVERLLVELRDLAEDVRVRILRVRRSRIAPRGDGGAEKRSARTDQNREKQRCASMRGRLKDNFRPERNALARWPCEISANRPAGAGSRSADPLKWSHGRGNGSAVLGRSRQSAAPLRENAAFRIGFCDALQRDAHGGHAPVALLLLRVLADRQVRALHALGQAILDLFQVPALRALVLQPLVVADRSRRPSWRGCRG